MAQCNFWKKVLYLLHCVRNFLGSVLVCLLSVLYINLTFFFLFNIVSVCSEQGVCMILIPFPSQPLEDTELTTSTNKYCWWSHDNSCTSLFQHKTQAHREKNKLRNKYLWTTSHVRNLKDAGISFAIFSNWEDQIIQPELE